jgi:hypothetical protein
MININQITTQLRMLPDQALQRVAMMYKQDPYILPLVVSEGMARKKLRAASQAQMAQPQPKVADQAVASLGYTPEESGIAQLQAQNMQGLADGGIAGYAEGGVADSAEDSFSRGGMFDFTQRSEPVVRMAEGGAVQRFQDRGLVTDPDEARYLAEQKEFDEGKRFNFSPETLEYFRKRREASSKRSAAEMREQEIARGRSLYQAQVAPSASSAAPAPAAASAAPAATIAATAPSSAPTASALPQRTSFPSQALERAVVQRPEAPPAAAPASAAPTFKSDPSLYSLDAAVHLKRAAELMPTNEYETAFNVQQQRELERLEAREAERERNKPTGKAREGLEALLKKEGEGAAKEKSDAGAFALISAGLAIASGESPNALMNIAKGLNVGAKEYQAAVKDLKKADRERKLMLADIEEARRLEAKGDYDKAEDRKDRIEERRSSIERNTMSGIMQLKLNRDQIAAGFAKAAQEGAIKRDLTGMDISSRFALAQAPGQQERLIERLGGGNFAEGYRKFRQEGQSPTLFANYEKMAADTTLNPLTGKTKGREFLAKYPTFDAYMSAFEAQQGGGGRGPSAVSSDPLGIRQ